MLSRVHRYGHLVLALAILTPAAVSGAAPRPRPGSAGPVAAPLSATDARTPVKTPRARLSHVFSPTDATNGAAIRALVASNSALRAKAVSGIRAAAKTPASPSVPAPGALANAVAHQAAASAWTLVSASPAAGLPGSFVTVTDRNGSATAMNARFVLEDMPGKPTKTLADVTRLGPTSIRVKLPPMATQRELRATLTLQNRSATGSVSSPLPLRLLPNMPFLQAMDRARVTGGETFILTGTGFSETTEVYLKALEPGFEALDALRQGGQWYWPPEIPRNDGHPKSRGPLRYCHVVAVSATRLAVQIPYETPIPLAGLPVEVYACNAAQPTSPSRPLRCRLEPVIVEVGAFRSGPAIEAVQFTRGENSDTYGTYCPSQPRFGAEHHSGTVTGHRGDDRWTLARPLLNGWLCQRVWFERQRHGRSDARVGSPAIVDGKVQVSVHWWVDPPSNEVFYNLDFILRGPLGLPMFSTRP